jgi:asparagine synthase (glutamine-hydrolysing)
MIEIVKHRGPDDTGFFFDEDIGLANARLSIIDIEGGHQPIHNEDGTIHVTYNGEIYNFQELRTQLETRGHRFYTRSDTEVIVHTYEEYGESFAARLNGMFAIAIWDSKNRKLLLARDRMGIKPLYYSTRNQTLLFASELKGILQAPIDRIVEPESLYLLLNLGYIPGDLTLLRGIRKLPPSSYLVFHEKSVRIENYWDVPVIDPETSEEPTVERLRSVLAESIRDQLVADVPVGCFLSGGLDTSTIVAYASKASSQPLKTFCMGFGEETDEFKDARLIADRFGTDHHELTVDSSQGIRLYPKMIWHVEAPKYNLYPWFVCELVRKYVRVCLSGNGGDEVFGGYYARYRNALKVEQLAKNPASSLLRRTGSVLQMLSEDTRIQNRMRVLKALGDDTSEYLILAGVLPDSFNRRFFQHSSGFTTSKLRRYYSPYFENADLLQGLMNAELRTKLVDDLLSVDDTMSMAHSLELRVPLLDNRVVDLMTAVPWQMKYAPGSYGKLLLRKAISDVLPEESFRKPKWGFSVNVHAWYKGELGELVRQVLPESKVIRRYFSQQMVQKLIARTISSRDRRYQVLLWQLLGFHFWHRIFVESDRVGAASLEVNSLVA